MNKKYLQKLVAVVVLIFCLNSFRGKPYGMGEVYCIDNGQTCLDIRNFRVNQNGTVTDVCGGPEYIVSGADCIKVDDNAKFSATPLGK